MGRVRLLIPANPLPASAAARYAFKTPPVGASRPDPDLPILDTFVEQGEPVEALGLPLGQPLSKN